MDPQQMADMHRIADAIIAFHNCYTTSSDFIVRDTNPWAALVVISRVMSEERAGRHLSPIKLIGDVAPAMISQSTALRMISRMETRGMLVIRTIKRQPTVFPTPLLYAELQAYATCFGVGFGALLEDLPAMIARLSGLLTDG